MSSSSKRVTKNPSGGFNTGRKPASNQIHFMGDYKGKVVVAPTGILRQDRTLKDQEADHLSRMEELNGHKRLLVSLRERLSQSQLESLVSCDSPRRRERQHSKVVEEEQAHQATSAAITTTTATAGALSPPRYKPLDISPSKKKRGYSPDANFLLPLKPEPESPRGRGMSSLISIIRTSLVMEGLLVNGPGGIRPKPPR